METKPGDLVLIHHKGEPMVYARVEEILADVKPGWWQVRLMLLQVPANEVNWILRDEYVDGAEFTMGGEPVTLQPVPAPALSMPEDEPIDHQTRTSPIKGGQGKKVVSISDRLKRGNHNGGK
jgi:hypothetical protein